MILSCALSEISCLILCFLIRFPCLLDFKLIRKIQRNIQKIYKPKTNTIVRKLFKLKCRISIQINETKVSITKK
ncbi:hypothetical protein BDF14DRAFT_1844966, partial [Spinellus fusiger]